MPTTPVEPKFSPASGSGGVVRAALHTNACMMRRLSKAVRGHARRTPACGDACLSCACVVQDTVRLLEAHQQKRGQTPRIVLWAHNSHLGDARATDMSWRRNELNVGQLVRETWPGQAYNIGFTTHAGSVTAAQEWDDPAHKMRVRPSMVGSVERMMVCRVGAGSERTGERQRIGPVLLPCRH